MSDRLPAATLRAFAATLLARVGLEADKAAAVAEVLVEGDLLGTPRTDSPCCRRTPRKLRKAP